MSIFKRSIIREILGYFGISFSLFVIIWINMLLTRLVGEIAIGKLNFNILPILANFSTITALPIILCISVFISILITVSRSNHEHEMIIWASSGASIIKWMNPILSIAIPVSFLIGFLTFIASPWSYRQMEKHYEKSLNSLKISENEFIQLNSHGLVLFIGNILNKNNEFENIFVRIFNPQWISFLKAEKMYLNNSQEEHFFTLEGVSCYDINHSSLESKITYFNEYKFVLAKNKINKDINNRKKIKSHIKAVSTFSLFSDNSTLSKSQIIWRCSIPLSTINLALLALQLGIINFKNQTKKFLVSGIIAFSYMSLINLSQSLVESGIMDLFLGIFLIDVLPIVLNVLLIYNTKEKLNN